MDAVIREPIHRPARHHPQASSHIGVVHAARAIAKAQERAASRGQIPAAGSGAAQEEGS